MSLPRANSSHRSVGGTRQSQRSPTRDGGATTSRTGSSWARASTPSPPPSLQSPLEPRGLRIEQTSPDQLLGLRAVVDPAEWSEGGFASDDIELAWCATDDTGQTVAAANLTPFDGVPSDVGVLTDPMVGGHGAGTIVASVAATHAIQEFGIARWRALTTNSASLRIAEKLAFEIDCLQIALRPPKM